MFFLISGVKGCQEQICEMHTNLFCVLLHRLPYWTQNGDIQRAFQKLRKQHS